MLDAAVCKYFSYHVPTSCQVINEANKSDIQLSVLTTEVEVQPMFFFFLYVSMMSI